MEVNYASEASNCVIDRYGRIASRKGFQYLTTNPEVLGGNSIEVLFEFVRTDTGEKYIFATGNNQIFFQDPSQSDLVPLNLPVAYVVNANNWQMASLNNKCYFVQAGHAPLVFDPTVSTTDLAQWAELPETSDFPNAVHAAFGRIWCTSFDSDSGRVYFSGLLDGENWTDQGTGAFDTSLYWPSGYDAITAVAAHNDFLVVFGKRNILVYTTTSDVVSTLNLRDTIEGIGCIARDSVVATGIDFMFIDSTGVRSLNRTIQEKSMPIGDISRNVRNDFQFALTIEPDEDISAVFHVEDSFYACFLPSNPLTYVFDTWQLLQNGSARVTTWTNIAPRCGVRLESRETLFGGAGGVYRYTGGSDIVITGGEDVITEIPMAYITHPLDFGSPVNLIFPKQVDVTIFGALTGGLSLKWGYDYAEAQEPRAIQRNLAEGSAFSLWYSEGTPTTSEAVGEWTSEASPTGEMAFWSTGTTLQQLRYNIWGQGRNVRLGLFASTLGAPISIQELNIQALQGRIL
jgi:hypothetical protein